MINKNAKSNIDKIAEEQLAIRGLSEEKIEGYKTISELESSLQRLEDLKNIIQLKGVDNFLKEIDPNNEVTINSYSDIKDIGRICTEIFQLRKKLITERICNIKNQTLKSLIEKLPEDINTEELKQQVKDL